MFYRVVIFTTLSSVACSLLSGCSIVLPEHSKSNERTSEQVSLTMLKFDDYCSEGKRKKSITTTEEGTSNDLDEFWSNYDKAYPASEVYACSQKRLYYNVNKSECIATVPASDSAGAFAVSGIIASAAIGLASDYIKKQIEKEKKLYTAQYSGRLIDDSFWEYESASEVEDCVTDDKERGKRVVTADSWKQRYIGKYSANPS